MARVVVSGGAGFLGSHLCDALLERGDSVVCIDNLITGHVRNIEHNFGRPGFTFVEHNVSEFVWVPGPVDVVMHLASPASPVDYLLMPIPTLKVGSLGTHNTLGLAKAKGAGYFLASTSEVYGDPKVHPQPEDYWGHVNPVGPRGVYDEAKRFAEALTMAYHRFHGLRTRIVRIFNSILADEQVLYDDGNELRREPVVEAAQRVRNGDVSTWRVPAFDRDGQLGVAATSALVGHAPTGPCYEVHTRYGRSVRVTGDHSLFVEGTSGAPEARPVAQLKTGDRVAIAGRVEVPVRDRQLVAVLDSLERQGWSDWDLFVRAPGVGHVVWERRFDVFAALASRNPQTAPRWRCHVWGRVAGHRDRDQLPLAVLRRIGLAIPDGASVRPRTSGLAGELPVVFHVTDEFLWLLGLFVAEGAWHESTHDAFIVISCERAVLDRAAKVVERDLGLHVCWGRNQHGVPQIFVHSKLLISFLRDLGFGPGAKGIPGWILGSPLARLAWFLEGYREGDGVHSGKTFVAAKRHEFSTTSTALKDDLIVAFGRFGLVPSVGRYRSRIARKDPERWFPFWRLTLCDVHPWSPLDWPSGVQQRLNARRFGDIVWARVKRIDEVPPTELVYDFCVPGLENFWAGSGVMAHNTYGERMRPDDGRVVSNFLVQAIKGEPLTVYGDGSQTRSFCYVSDEIRGFLALLDSDLSGPVNIGNPNEFTVLELARIVLEVTGSTSEIVFEPLPVDDPTQRQPDITLARDRLGWEPVVELREGLTRTADYFRGILGG